MAHTNEAERVTWVVDAAGGLVGRAEASRALAGDAEAVATVQAAGAEAVLARIQYERRVSAAIAEAAGDTLLLAECGALLGAPAASDALWRASKSGDTPSQAARRVLLAIGARIAP